MALAHSRGARIPVHSLRGPLLAAYPLSLWKITNAHKVTVEPSQPPTEPIWSSLKRSNYHPLCAAVWGCLLFHYLFEQIGLRLVLVCGGLIVTRDERLQRARCCGTGGSPSHSAVSSARLISCLGLCDSSTFPGQWSVAVLTYAICSIDGEMFWLVLRIPRLGKYTFMRPICHIPWGDTHVWQLLTAQSHPLEMKAFLVALRKIVIQNMGVFFILIKMNLHLNNEGTKWHHGSFQITSKLIALEVLLSYQPNESDVIEGEIRTQL